MLGEINQLNGVRFGFGEDPIKRRLFRGGGGLVYIRNPNYATHADKFSFHFIGGWVNLGLAILFFKSLAAGLRLFKLVSTWWIGEEERNLGFQRLNYRQQVKDPPQLEFCFLMSPSFGA